MRGKADIRMLEERTRNAGGGVWFRKEPFEQVFVEVCFYPKLILWLNDSSGRRRITKQELDSDYYRLRV